MCDCEERVMEAVMRERAACVEICERIANMIIALGVTGNAVTTAQDIAKAIKARNPK